MGWHLPEITMDEMATTQEYAYARLRNAIMVGAIEPGTSLTMRGLASYLELSPTPVREAIRRLSSEHAVTVLENRRILVPTMELGRFDELIKLRVAMETHAARSALPYVSGIIVEKLHLADDKMDSSIDGGDFDTLSRLNQKFHRTLYEANPNQAVVPLLESIWLQLGPFQRQVVSEVKRYYVVDRHKEILAALDARDEMALVIAIEADIRDGIERTGRELLSTKKMRKLA
jgi:DNA-binding GntR family transcriptional regulator